MTDTSARKEDAAALAVRALAYLAADTGRLSRFLALTGLDPDAVRAAATQPGFLAGVLDYVCADEAVLCGFAADAAVAPPEVERAREILSGRRWERDFA
jgi:hypothetical protein